MAVVRICAGEAAAKALPCSDVDDNLAALCDSTVAMRLMCGHFASPVRTTTCSLTMWSNKKKEKHK